jgi:hypothetical protein
VWHVAGLLAAWALDEPIGSGTGGNELIVIIGGIATALIGGIVAVTVATIQSRANRNVSPTSTPSDRAVMDSDEVRRRLDDGDETNEMQDRRHDRHERAMDRFAERLERLEDHHDQTNPGWRRGP